MVNFRIIKTDLIGRTTVIHRCNKPITVSLGTSIKVQLLSYRYQLERYLGRFNEVEKLLAEDINIDMLSMNKFKINKELDKLYIKLLNEDYSITDIMYFNGYIYSVFSYDDYMTNLIFAGNKLTNDKFKSYITLLADLIKANFGECEYHIEGYESYSRR